jgi:type I restriction-modification system DNA methylase subunit
MTAAQARQLIKDSFTQAFDKARFRTFAINLLNHVDESKAFARHTPYIKEAFRAHVHRFERLGTYTSPAKESVDVLIVHLTADSKLERARTAIRNFVADHLKDRENKDAALVAFVSPTEQQWRFSYVKMDYATVEKESGKIGVETRLTPARRFSYLVGEGESCHTAQTRFLGLLQGTATDPTLDQVEEAFSVEAVTKEFFGKYAELFGDISAALEKLVAKDKTLRDEFSAKGVNAVDFAKKLMGQIVFLYFLQKKGWLGVEKGNDWGTGPRNFLRKIVAAAASPLNIFNDILEPLFYDTLASDRGHEAWCTRFKCRIPFLNGGLFEPLGDYDWKKTDIILPNKLFTNDEYFEEGITGTGVLDVFDRYNFTVNEAEPLEKEVAIDPEMLGKVFENLLEVKERKSKGSFYTPREIVHYMCQESLINYLDSAINSAAGTAPTVPSHGGTRSVASVPRADIETFVRLGEQISHYEAVDTKYAVKMPKSIQENARTLDDALKTITVCDPAVGSGAFPVGMMTEIVRARAALTPYFNDIGERTPYHFKRHAIQNCLYGVDIDPSAVEIAKLRLWLSLVVDEEDVKQVKPLPNLDYKVVVGNSLLGVEKNLFNENLFLKLEDLKHEYFNSTRKDKKDTCKKQIDYIIHELTNSNEAFDFEVYFSEVFHRKGGFDIVTANPPYLESRNPAFSDTLKNKLQQDVGRRWPGIKTVECIPRGSDLLIYFLETGVRLVSNSGIVAFITQNAWLDTDYGKNFQRFLLARTHVTLIVDSDFKHFDSIDGPNINTVISFFHGKTPSQDGYTTFARFQRAFSPGVISSSGLKVEGLRDGIRYRQYSYSGSRLRNTKWGMLLSLDDTILDLLCALEAKAIPLGRTGSCMLSFGQGLNLTKDYYVSPQQSREIKCNVAALIPILTSADGAPFEIRKTSNHLLNAADFSKHEITALTKVGIRVFDLTSTSKQPPILIMPRGIGRHFCALNSAKAFSSSYVDIYCRPSPANDDIVFSLWAVMNSSAVWLLREAAGRKNLGGGMLKAEAVDLKEIPLLMNIGHLNEIKKLFVKLSERDALDSISEIESEEHRLIDEIVFDYLDLSFEKRKLVVGGLRQKIMDRMSKSES